jgi:hypothetical protein
VLQPPAFHSARFHHWPAVPKGAAWGWREQNKLQYPRQPCRITLLAAFANKAGPKIASNCCALVGSLAGVCLKLGKPLAGISIVMRQGAQIEVIGSKVLRSPPCRQCNFCLQQFRLNSWTTATVTSSWRAKTSVKSRSNLSPQMCAPVIVQLPRDANFARRLAHGSLKDIAYWGLGFV